MRFRAVVGNDATLRRTFYVGSTPADASGSVTVAVTREDGSVLTGGTASSVGSGVYTFALGNASHTSRPDVLTVQWTGTWSDGAHRVVDSVDVVRSRMFELAELKNFPTALNPAPTDEALEVARRQVEDAIEDKTRRAWFRRYARDRFNGDGSSTTARLSRWPARALISVKVDGVVQTITSWTIDEFGLVNTGGVPFAAAAAGQNVDIQYEHGADDPPDDLRRAALQWARHLLAAPSSELTDRANMVQYDWGSFRLNQASVQYPSGLPEVDATVERYDRREPFVV